MSIHLIVSYFGMLPNLSKANKGAISNENITIKSPEGRKS